MRIPSVVLGTLMLALAGCASAQPTAPTPAVPVESNDATLIRALDQEQAGLDAELNHPGPPLECARKCELGSQICDDSGRICALSNRNAGDEAMSKECSEAADRCTEADLAVKTSGCACAQGR